MACISTPVPNQVAPPSDADFFVSAGASDTARCTAADPCSLTHARDLARLALPASRDDVIVELKGGLYALTETFALTGDQDSGRNGHQMIYRSARGEQAILSGGMSVGGWQNTGSGNLVSAQVPEGMTSRSLYVNGKRAIRALEPAPGLTKVTNGFTVPVGFRTTWKNLEDLEFVGLTGARMFRCGVSSITSNTLVMDAACWALANNATAPYPSNVFDAPVWMENAYEFLSDAGEWYLDQPTHTLFYLPREGEDVGQLDAQLGKLETLVTLTGSANAPIENLTLRGLFFAYAGWQQANSAEGYVSFHGGVIATGTAGNIVPKTAPASVMMTYANNVRVERCTFKHLGAAGLAIREGSKNTKVVGNRFFDLSGSAILLGGPEGGNETDVNKIIDATSIENNSINDIGLEYSDAAAIFVGFVNNTSMTHNRIHNVPSFGVTSGWGWLTSSTVGAKMQIVGNVISQACTLMPFCGFVHTDAPQPNSTISDNYFHNAPIGTGSVYLGYATSGYVTRNNVIAASQYWTILQVQATPFANNNIFENNYTDNTVVFCINPVAGGCPQDGYGNIVNAPIVASAGVWLPAAQTIMKTAGLEDAYLDVTNDAHRVEAESYDTLGPNVSYYDSTTGNVGNTYRVADYVDLYTSRVYSNANAVGSTTTGEWLRYTFDVPRDGTYEFRAGAATTDTIEALTFEVDGAVIGSMALPNTGSYSRVSETVGPKTNLKRGQHTLKVTFTGLLAFDYFSYTYVP